SVAVAGAIIKGAALTFNVLQ
nr:RecName: Full=Equinatoxin-3; AltName: Full=DELTA-actitoxin; AltName: Full=Equinatoxin III; Short=EqT III; Short=EqT-III; Short=EqTIII [Actinia equina]